MDLINISINIHINTHTHISTHILKTLCGLNLHLFNYFQKMKKITQPFQPYVNIGMYLKVL